MRAELLTPLITQADIFHSRNVTCNLDENHEFLPFLLLYPDSEMDDTLIHEHSALGNSEYDSFDAADTGPHAHNLINNSLQLCQRKFCSKM